MATLGYDRALAELRRALAFGINPSLAGITALCDALGRPQDSFPTVQITGTNGKSSTARFTAALLHEEGIRTGLYTSPELERYPERMEVDGAVVSDTEFAAAVSASLEAAEELRPRTRGSDAGFTEFELLTASALWLFRERGVEAAVLEVGMGGRWDATSVAAARVAVVTGVGLDHTAILGDTLQAIAVEKAAIIRTGATVVLGEGTVGLEGVFLAAADRVGAPVETARYEIKERPYTPDGATVFDVVTARATHRGLMVNAPAYQAANAATAIGASEALLGRAVGTVRASRAVTKTVLPGRFEMVRRHPPVVVDGSHNPQAAAVLAGAIADAWPDSTARPGVLLGVLADKDARGIVEALVPAAGWFAVTRPDSLRGLPAIELAGVVERATGSTPRVFDSVSEAIEALVPVEPRGLVITGSLTTAGQARAALRERTA